MRYLIIVSVEGSSSRESVEGKSKIQRYNDIVLEVSFNSHSLGSVFSNSTDLDNRGV